MTNRVEAKILIKSALLENSCTTLHPRIALRQSHQMSNRKLDPMILGTMRSGDNRTERFNHDPVGVAGVAMSVPH